MAVHMDRDQGRIRGWGHGRWRVIRWQRLHLKLPTTQQSILTAASDLVFPRPNSFLQTNFTSLCLPSFSNTLLALLTQRPIPNPTRDSSFLWISCFDSRFSIPSHLWTMKFLALVFLLSLLTFAQSQPRGTSFRPFNLISNFLFGCRESVGFFF